MRSIACRWYRRRAAGADIALGSGVTRAQRHVRSCERCRRVLRDTDLVAGELGLVEMQDPSSARLWRQIEARLEGAAAAATPPQQRSGRLALGVRWIVDEAPTWAVGIVAVMAVLGVWQARDWASSRSAARPQVQSDAEFSGSRGLQLAMVPLSLDVGSYVASVARSSPPDEFWSAYRARDPEPDDPYRDLDFQPLVPEELPHGFRIVDSKLLRDACCETLLVRYQAADRWLDIFQCHDDHPIEFGQASVDRRDVSGIVCTAFGWRRGEIRGRSFSLGELSLVLVGNVTDDVLDAIVVDLSKR